MSPVTILLYMGWPPGHWASRTGHWASRTGHMGQSLLGQSSLSQSDKAYPTSLFPSPISGQTWRLKDPGQRTCEQRLYRSVSWLRLTINLSLHLESAVHHSISVHTADFGQHTEIALQGTLNRHYKLRLFIENEELELQTQDNQTWTPAQRPYVPCFFTTNASRWL